MDLMQLFSEHRIRLNMPVSEECVVRIVQLLLVDWKFCCQSTDHQKLVFNRHDETALLSNNGDVAVRTDSGQYDMPATILD